MLTTALGIVAMPVLLFLFLFVLNRHFGSKSGNLANKEDRVPSHLVKVVDDPKLKDGMKTNWSAEDVADCVANAVETFHPSKVLSFDPHGVSGHPNHISTCVGVRHYLQTRGNSKKLEGWELESVNLLSKLCGLANVLLTLLWLSMFGCLSTTSKKVIISPDPGAGINAMLKHWSQLVWYRLIFIFISSYTYMNTLHRSHPSP
eukprot:gene3194-13211_t